MSHRSSILAALALTALGLVGCTASAPSPGTEDVEEGDSAITAGSARSAAALEEGLYDEEDRTLVVYREGRTLRFFFFSRSLGNGEVVPGEAGRASANANGHRLELVADGETIAVKGSGPAVGSYVRRPSGALHGA